MALSFSEKRALQKVIFEQREILSNSDLSFSEKRKSQKIIFDCREKLGTTVSETVVNDSPVEPIEQDWDEMHPMARSEIASFAGMRGDYFMNKSSSELQPYEKGMLNDGLLRKSKGNFKLKGFDFSEQPIEPAPIIEKTPLEQNPKPLVAPNGKPSKLNAMQHAQVRTPEFKAWFGDFEAVAKLQALKNQKAFVIDDASLANLTLEELRNEVTKRYNEKKSNSEITTDGRNIRFTKIGLKEVRQHSADRKVLDLLSKAHEVLPNAIPLWSEEHSKKNAGDSIRTWHYYGAKVGLNNKDYFARFVVREDVNGNIYYDNDLTTVENISGHSVDATATKSRTADVSTDERSIKQWVNSINGNSSKVIDSNGEPLVVYHGTDADIAEFATEKAGENGIASGLGSFFTDNADYASGYAEKLGGNVVPVMLSLKNPLMVNEYYGIDAVDRIAFDYEANAEYGKTLEELENSEDASDNEKAGVIYSLFGRGAGADYFSVKNAQVQKTLIKMGYDGVILKGDKQSESKEDLVFIAFNSSQIKSATGNKGSFSPKSTSILDSIQPFYQKPPKPQQAWTLQSFLRGRY